MRVGVVVMLIAATGCETPSQQSSKLKASVLRLTPGQDLKQEILAYVKQNDMKAAAVVTCVGSLTEVHLRYANRETGHRRQGHFEIVSLVGTCEPSGGHLHLSISDADGTTFGGHMLDGCKVHTTAEVVLLELTDLAFRRELDGKTGYKELVIEPRGKK